MKKQLFFAAAFFSLVGSLQAQQQSPTDNAMMDQGGNMMMQGDCSSLKPDQQNFANQLSPMNKMMFCSKFNDQQRAQAMQMSGQTDAYGNTMTNDQAVQKIAQDNNMMMPMQGGNSQKGAVRGCPVQ